MLIDHIDPNSFEYPCKRNINVTHFIAVSKTAIKLTDDRQPASKLYEWNGIRENFSTTNILESMKKY